MVRPSTSGVAGSKPDAKARRTASTSPARAAANTRAWSWRLAAMLSTCAFRARQLLKPWSRAMANWAWWSLALGLPARNSASRCLAVFLSQSMLGRAGRACGMEHLLSLRPATAALGQERRRCQLGTGGGFNPLRGPSVACSTVVSLHPARAGRQSDAAIGRLPICNERDTWAERPRVSGLIGCPKSVLIRQTPIDAMQTAAGRDRPWLPESREGIMLTRRAFIAGASLASVSIGARPAAAQGYPTQTIRIMAGFPAGGGIDVVARLLAEPFKAMGQPVIVENRTGAAGMIAAQAVAKAPPDGHMLLVATSGEIAILQHLYRDKMTYDPINELAPLALVGIVPCVVVVADTAPIRTPQELIAYAKANPKKLSFSSSGVGNPQHLAGELMNMMAGTDVLHVPYRGAAPAVADVATGAVTMSFSSLAAALPLIEAGKLRAVAVTSLERMPQLPDVAPLSEGAPELKDYELLNWFALFATGGTPPAIVHRLNAIVATGLRDKAISEKLEAQGIVPRVMTPAQYRAFVAAETEKFGKIVAQANIKVE